MFVFINAVKKLLSVLVTVFISLGIITGVSTDQPIQFEDSENVKMSFVAVADTHTLADSFSGNYLKHIFDDAENSEETFNAIVVAGDLTELGLACEYEHFFAPFETQSVFENVLLTTGNHDVRFNYKANTELIMSKVEQYNGIEIGDKSYYSYEINGYKFIVMGTEAQVFEKAYISDTQLAWLDSELDEANAAGLPAFVICHQPLQNTHGLPEVWKTGDLGEQSDEVRAILEAHKNVFYICGHLHDGIYEKSMEVLNAENNVWSLNLPTYKKSNDYGVSDNGTGYYCEVYSDRVVFTARNFKQGTAVTADYGYYSIDLV